MTDKKIKSEKVSKVSTLEQTIKSASSVVFVDYTGMDMKSQQGLMKDLKAGDGKMIVAKNTLIRIASKNANLPEDALSDTVLSGQTAMVVGSGDPVSPLSVIAKFIKQNEKPKFKAGVIEGTFYNAANLDKLSKLPGKNELVAQVIGSLSSPLYGLVGTLNGNIQKLVYILQAKAKQA